VWVKILKPELIVSSEYQLDNGNARNLLQETDEWETKNIYAYCRVAEVKHLFDKTKEYNALNE
jgi:hypothetical protein